jgi:hypothetical protein
MLEPSLQTLNLTAVGLECRQRGLNPTVVMGRHRSAGAEERKKGVALRCWTQAQQMGKVFRVWQTGSVPEGWEDTGLWVSV